MTARIAALLLSAWALTSAAVAQPAPSVEELPQFSTGDSNGNAFGPLLPRNRPTDVRGVQAVCTGIDSDSRADPRWSGFPLKLEFTSPNGAYLAFAQVSVADAKGKPVISVRCPGAWLLLGLPPGEYKATVAVPNAADEMVGFSVPRTGQKSVVLRFTSRNPAGEGGASAAPAVR
jgi:hypothetical protein